MGKHIILRLAAKLHPNYNSAYYLITHDWYSDLNLYTSFEVQNRQFWPLKTYQNWNFNPQIWSVLTTYVETIED